MTVRRIGRAKRSPSSLLNGNSGWVSLRSTHPTVYCPRGIRSIVVVPSAGNNLSVCASSLRKPGHRGQMHGRGRARWWQDMLRSPKRRHAERHEANRSQRAEPDCVTREDVAIHDWLFVPPLAVALAWSFAETRSVGWISDSVIHHLPVGRRITLSPIRPTVCSFIHSTFVRQEHPGRRLTLSAICLYVGRVVTRAAAKLPH